MKLRGRCLFAGAGLVSLLLVACDSPSAQGIGGDISSALDVCGEGKGEFAAHVCASRELASLDSAVRDVLVAESANVSEAGAQLLVQNQRRWREAQRVSCGVADAAAALDDAQTECLENRMRARANEVQTAVQEVGGYVFQRMELVDAMPVAASIAAATGRDEPAVVRDIRFPRIDGPQTPEVQAFNDMVAQQPQFRLQDATNETVDYVIAYAGPDVISVRFVHTQDQLRAATPSSTLRSVNVVMQERRPLAENDVFRADSGWQRFITDRAVREISRQFSDYRDFPPPRDVYETATKPHLWLVNERGLTLLFPPLSFGGSHVDGAAEVLIPWADLGPYLNPQAPAPIGTAAAG